jgi:asparagine synthase (glutamine-hydrolysing)
MCGISGIVNAEGTAVPRDALKKMNDTLSRRGPDAEGFFFSERVGLGHRRLAIIDLESGAQPMTSSDGRYTIVFNGEIYNFMELKPALEKSGVVFRTHSDTEVLLELFARKGMDCLRDLNGMFAFAVWDAREKKLFAARDRMGKKPFYYALVGGSFIFGSELKALLAFPGFPKRLNPAALAHYLTYEYVPAPLAMIDGAFKLKQAHWLTFQNGVIETGRYWAPPLGEKVDDDEETASRKLLELLDKAVAYRMIADVPLGVFLSGGVDSSAVVALMARHREGKDIKTFSINFKEGSYDESLYSETVAKKFGTDHASETLTAATMLAILPEVLDYLDEPFADGSILPTYLLSRFTRQRVTVALGGDGADELFAGYPTFLASRVAGIYRKMPGWFRKAARSGAGLLSASDRNMSFDFKVRQFLKGADLPGVEKNQIWLAAVAPQDQAALYAEDFRARTVGIDTLQLVRDEMKSCPASGDGDELLYFYQKFYMCDDILFKVDRASMANSLEVRAPFLDRDVVDYVSRLPYSYKLKGVTSKFLLKKTFNRALPTMITQRGKKGFGIPIAGWLKEELKPVLLDTLNEKRVRRDGYFDWMAVKGLVDSHLSGKVNQRKPLFALLMLHWWMDRYLFS